MEGVFMSVPLLLRHVVILGGLFCIVLFQGCSQNLPVEDDTVTIVFKHGKIAGNATPLELLIKRFEAENPGIRVKDEPLPATTDEQHQFYVINLEGRSSDFDVLSMDVIWVQEFARAGWLRPLDGIFPPEEREEFFEGPVRAVTYRGSVYGIPWYIDAGILYYRKDLLEKYNLPVPRTWTELISAVRKIKEKEDGVYGFIWQGRQYEGLICNVMEYMWGNGGGFIDNGGFHAMRQPNIEALAFMRGLIVQGITPEFVTTSVEETTRHIFGSGRAIFMRNWPYAWNIFNREDSPVKGRIGVTMLPAFEGREPFSTLGGWQLGINRYSRHPREAERFIRFLTSYESQKTLALTIGYKPTRKALYMDRDLRTQQPFMVELYHIFERAKPRPLTPYYMMISQILQIEFSSVIAGIKTPEDALSAIDTQVGYILRLEEN